MNAIEKQMEAVLSATWWVLLLRGLVAILFGILAWTRPGITLATLVMFWGAYVFVDGILGVGTAIAGGKAQEHRWLLALWGLLGVWVGVTTFRTPGITAVVLLFFMAIWAIATGVLQIAAAIRLRKEIEGEWLLGLGGLTSVVFGGFLMSQPAAGALALVRVVAAYAVVYGVLFAILAFKARSFGMLLAGPHSNRG
jgi:uncharacterized membrane protein HdeD (DUF308 family)